MHFHVGAKVRMKVSYNVNSKVYFRTESIRDIVSKIKFPHGLHNTVDELVSASRFPVNSRDWPASIGQPPSNAEIEQSRKLFEKEQYPNMYR